eukprot:6532197-Prymnesium_polylepis.1
MAAAATVRQAATAAQTRAAAAVLPDLLAKVGDAAACGSVRLLLEELAAAPQAGPQRQVQQGAATGQATRSRTRRRREQRRVALVRLLSSSAAAGDGLDACGGPTKQVKDQNVEPELSPAQELATGERLV